MQSSKLSKIACYVMSICYKSSWLPAFISDHHIVKLSPLRSNPFLAETFSEYSKANERYFRLKYLPNAYMCIDFSSLTVSDVTALMEAARRGHVLWVTQARQ